MNKLNLEVLTPERAVVDQSVDAVYLQGSQGRLGILPGHTMLIAKMSFGVLELSESGDRGELLCGEGLVEVDDNRVTILVNSAERREEIDVERAQRALDRAKQRRDSKDADIDMDKAETALNRAVERLKFTGRL